MTERVGFFEELRRRNIFRVGIAYAVGAWLLLQMTEVLSELLKLPDQVGPIVVALVAIGFPVALFFAWAFELTPEGVKRESEVDRSQSATPATGKKLNLAISIMLAVAVAYLLFDKFAGAAPDSSPAENTAVTAAEPPTAAEPEPEPEPKSDISPRSIAVLPFDNRSRLEDDEFFVDGIHDDLLTSLARIGSLKVISRTSVSKYKETTKSIPEIATELGVATIMEGAVQRAGDVVRINVQLIDAQTDEHLWAEIFDREMTTKNLFEIQSEISTAIAGALEATLSTQEQARLANIPTESIAAYNAFLRGRQLMSRRNAESLEAAAREFDRAVELDPGYALAWVGVAEVNGLLRQYSMLDNRMLMARRSVAAERAMELDDTLGEAHIALATYLDDTGQKERSESAFRRGIELSPNYAPGHQWFGLFLSERIDRLTEAVEQLDIAVNLDPLSSIVQVNRYDVLAAQGRFAEARRQLRSLEQSDPEFPPLYMRLGGFPFNAHTRLDEALPYLRKGQQLDPGNALYFWLEGLAQISLGDMKATDHVLAQLENINAKHWSVSAITTSKNIYLGNYLAAAESGRQTGNNAPDATGVNNWLSVVIAYRSGDYATARKLLLEVRPKALDPTQWADWVARSPSEVCTAGWILQQSGDQELGKALLAQGVDFMTNIAPLHMNRPERLPLSICLAALGDREGALSLIEAKANLDYSFTSHRIQTQPAYEDLRSEPRFIAAVARINKKRDEQRANIERMKAEGTL